MGYTAILHVILAGLFMYAYLRTMKLSPLAALIGALAFEMNGFLIARAGFLSVTAAVPWLAAWLWRAEKLQEAASSQRSAVSHVLWLALVIGLGILAGHAQTAVYGLVLRFPLFCVAHFFQSRISPSLRTSSLSFSLLSPCSSVLALPPFNSSLRPNSRANRSGQAGSITP